MVPFIRLEKYSGSNQVSCRGLAFTKVSSKMKPLKQLRTILWSLKKATIVPIGQSNQSDQRAWMISGFWKTAVIGPRHIPSLGLGGWVLFDGKNHQPAMARPQGQLAINLYGIVVYYHLGT